MNSEEKEDSPLVRKDNGSQPSLEVTGRSQYSLSWYHQFVKKSKLVSAQVVVFCYTFIFTYFQNYTQQYIFQWYAIEALKNYTLGSNNSHVCYNQTLITDFSGCNNDTIIEVEQNSAHTNLIITVVTSILSLVVNLLVAPLSDRYGRKPAMIYVSLFGALSITVTVIATYLNLGLSWFILSGVLLGIGGGQSALWSVSFAYVSDIAAKQKRTFHLGFLQAMI